MYNLDHIKYKFDEGRVRVPEHIRGKCCFVLSEGIEEIRKDFGRPEAVLKVFFTEGTKTWGDPDWCGHGLERNREIGRASLLVEATAIQNLCWMGGFAPRVYGLIEVERNGKIFPAQVIEFIKGEVGGVDKEKVMTEMDKFLFKFDVRTSHNEMVGQHDFIDGKLIDFQGFTFREGSREKIIAYIREVGRYGKAHYQSIPELGVSAKPRDTESRIKEMGLDKVDFKGKNVLDIGCNSGVFCNYASKMGAKRVVGIDMPNNVKASQVLAFYLGYHNNDYFAFDLTGGKPIIDVEIDITLLLSMVCHIGLPEWIGEITKELLIVEENAKGSKYDTGKWSKMLLEWFNDVYTFGFTNDHNPNFPKPVIWAKK